MTKTIELSDSDLQCLQMGRSLMLVGMKRASVILEEQIAFTQNQLHATEVELKASTTNGVIRPAMQRTLAIAAAAAEAESEEPPKKREYKKRSKGMKGYWASMSPEQRSAEMARRKEVTAGKAASADGKFRKKLVQPNHPRDANHPEHAKWVKKMRRVNRKSWGSLTSAQRTARIGAALAGRRAAAAARR